MALPGLPLTRRRLLMPAEPLRPATFSAVSRQSVVAVGMVFTLVSVVVAAWLSFGVRIAMGDALARSYSAMAAVQSAQPHLGAIGFIWPPLPTLLQLPLVLIPGATFYGFSGGIVSAVFAGATAVGLYLLLERAGVRPLLRWAAIGLFFLNPFILLYAGVGMSEMPFLCTYVFAVYAYLRWSDRGHRSWLLVAAFATGLMVLSRYDAVPFAVVFAAGVMVTMILSHRHFTPPKVEANLLAYLVPVVYVTVIWVYFNWQIMGDPLFFLRSEYSNAFLVRDVAALAEVRALSESPAALLRYALDLVLSLTPMLLPGVVLLAVVAWRRKDVVPLTLIALLLVVPAFQLLSYRQGQTFGFWRFYITLIPAGLIAWSELATIVRRPAVYRLTVALLFAGIIAGNVTTTARMLTMDKTEGACELPASVERVFVERLAAPFERIEQCAANREMAEYIVGAVPDRSIITDVTGREVVVFTRRPDLFILPSDYDYEAIGTAQAAPVQYVLTNATESSEFRALERFFPGINAGAADNLRLVYSAGNLHLYRVLR
jgi:hypothetical protein